MLLGSIFDFIDGKVAYITNTMSRFGAFWDSTLDRFADIALFLGLIYLYADLRRTDYVLVAALALTFSIMTSYARAPRRIADRRSARSASWSARAHRALLDRRTHRSAWQR
jgi:phosphatidylglycerophosphate synthase